MSKLSKKLITAAQEAITVARLERELQNRLGNWAVIHRIQPGHGVYGDLVTVSLRLTPGAMESLKVPHDPA